MLNWGFAGEVWVIKIRHMRKESGGYARGQQPSDWTLVRSG
jgi:hypothetical protein